jgi:hypothetical protein
MKDYGIRLDGLPVHGHLIPVYDPFLPVQTSRVLFVGDAAGTADPISGEGIRPAIKSGRLAAQAILEGNSQAYSSRFFWKIGIHNLFSMLVGVVFFPLRELCLILGAPNPFTTDFILDVVGGRRNMFIVMIWAIITLWGYLPLALYRELYRLFRWPRSLDELDRILFGDCKPAD